MAETGYRSRWRERVVAETGEHYRVPGSDAPSDPVFMVQSPQVQSPQAQSPHDEAEQRKRGRMVAKGREALAAGAVWRGEAGARAASASGRPDARDETGDESGDETDETSDETRVASWPPKASFQFHQLPQASTSSHQLPPASTSLDGAGAPFVSLVAAFIAGAACVLLGAALLASSGVASDVGTEEGSRFHLMSDGGGVHRSVGWVGYKLGAR